MIKKIFPVLLVIIGISGGVGAGLTLKPHDTEMIDSQSCGPSGGKNLHANESRDESNITSAENEFVKLNNQFVIPVVLKDKVEALVVMSLSVEVSSGTAETVYRREPKLRDAFLQVLFDHANMGGFQGEFTDTNKLDVLRASLLEVAHSVLGADVAGILITDIARQDA